MDPKHITSLAKLLRDNGDKVLSGEFKLSLSGPLLRALNDSFTLIADAADLTSPQSFQVVKPNNSKSDVFRDLQLVHDFVQKTLLLCICHFPGDESFEGIIDISKFRALRRLEVQKVNIKRITGIQPLRAQLQHLICNRSLNSVEDIITYCGGDKSNGFVWNELHTANFSYNNLKTVDSSLEFAQWLQNLTLSYNKLTSVEAIKWLPHLKVLDLRYNRLSVLPIFHTEASRRLQVLIISNNFIEDLRGISRLENLTELDLSNNLLLDHVSLLPLSTLVSLRYLNLQGNPLACNAKYRQVTVTYLNKNTSSVKFILDAEPLSNHEKILTGRFPQYHSALTSRLSLNSRSSGQTTPVKKAQYNTPCSSVGSVRSIKLNESEISDMTTSISSALEKQKKLKIRTVEIEGSKNSQDDVIIKATTKTVVNQHFIETNQEHLETKKQIEVLRKKYGAGWLQSENVRAIRSALGLNLPDETTEKVSPRVLLDDFLNKINFVQGETFQDSSNKNSTIVTSTPVKEEHKKTYSPSIDTVKKATEQGNNTEGSTFKTAHEVFLVENKTVYNSAEIDLGEVYPTSSESPEVSDPEENENTYIVREKDNTEELFLTVSDMSIREQNVLTKKTKSKWSLKILESCDRINSNTLRINFDTIKKDKKERIYTVEEGLCHELEQYLRDILSKRQLSEMNQIIYKCISCSCEFSRERMYHRINPVIFCPECKKSFVIEVNEPTKEISPLSKYLTITNNQSLLQPPEEEADEATPSINPNCEKNEPGKSSSHSSIANDKGTWRLSTQKNISSAGSLNESSSCSKISNSESSFNSNQSIAGSSTNERDNDFSFSKNYESDVEILSNPSQSSIEVLDHGHPSRKTSEERKISIIPSLETIQDQQSLQNTSEAFINKELSADNNQIEPPIKDNVLEISGKKVSLGPVNLTESSSSGSVTDSICTAYEQSGKDNLLQHADSKEEQKENLEKDNKKDKEDFKITSMFGGLFQSTNILMSRTQKITTSDMTPQCERFKFNYKDFSDVDHRLKLYFYQTKFENDDEHFKWLVKGKIFNENTLQFSEGIVIMSTKKFYIMEIFGPENEIIQKWLKQVINGYVDTIENIQLLPWKIGISFKIKVWGGFLLILQDELRIDSLLAFFENNPLPMQCTFDHHVPHKVFKKLSTCIQDEELRMLSILNKCEISSDNNVQAISPAVFFTTDTHLYITNSNISWLSHNSESSIEPALSQLMSNLVEVVKPAENICSINFLDETQDKYELWTCIFETKENAESCLNAIGESWEKLFGVPFVTN